MEPGAGDRLWFRDISDTIRERAVQQIVSRAHDQRQRELMLAAFRSGRLSQYPDIFSSSAHLPLLCAAAVSPNRPPPMDLAVATALMWNGLELHDDLTDGDLAPDLQQCPDFEIVLTAVALALLIPSAIIEELDVSPEIRCTMHRLISTHLLKAFAGQQLGLRQVGQRDVTAEQVLTSVRSKNGEPGALFAGLGAVAGGAQPHQVDAFQRYGRNLGIMAQLQADFWELFYDPEARDLVQRNRTLPIAAALERAEGAERTKLCELLDRAVTDAEARNQLRAELATGGNLEVWHREVHAAAANALAALAAAQPAEPAASMLRSQIHQRTPFC